MIKTDEIIGYTEMDAKTKKHIHHVIEVIGLIAKDSTNQMLSLMIREAVLEFANRGHGVYVNTMPDEGAADNRTIN